MPEPLLLIGVHLNLNIICDALLDLVPVTQFKKRKKHPWRSVTFA